MIAKQGFNIPFGQGLDLKTDPNQVTAGKLLGLKNSVFGKQQMRKRNGFPLLTILPNTNQTTLTTLNDNLIATGTNLLAYSANSMQWLDQGIVQPVALAVLPLIRNSTNITWSSSASASGLVCVVYGTASTAYYKVIDTVTGQSIVQQTALPSASAFAKVYVLGRNFIIVFTRTVGTSHLQYLSLPINNPVNVSAVTDLQSNMASVTTGWDAIVSNNNIYFAYNASDGGGAIRMFYMSSTFIQSATKVIAGHIGAIISITADESASTSTIWASFYDGAADTYAIATNQTLLTTLAPTKIISATPIKQLTSIANLAKAYFYYEVINQYSYIAVTSDYISTVTCTALGIVSSPSILRRGIGLASVAFFNSINTAYMLVNYTGTLQPTYFLMDGSGNIIAKLAYSNGAVLTTNILPNVTNDLNKAQISYLYQDLTTAVNKAQGVANVNGIYAQIGVNLVSLDINNNQQQSSEIASSLHLTGGFIWQYDTVKPVEHAFAIWPEDIKVTTSAAGGLLSAQTYFYQVTYEWTDSQGIIQRSAPSIPYQIVTAGATSSNTLNIPTLRLTAKVGTNPVRIVIYRWSAAQQNYYQITPITTPILNDTTIDSITFIDILADASILGNTLIYTTGGILENIAAPACTDSTLYKSRLMIIDAEDQNLIWYSKPVLSGVPVEFSDFQTIYVAPSASVQGPTGPVKCITAMDDKFIMFKKDAIYYLVGDGPDITGANGGFSEPTFITSTVGCSNPNSIVFSPLGIMFQSDKGIWLLGRDLSTSYIGADVQTFNDFKITSALAIPTTNEVRFTLSDGTVLMYDYYYRQWGTFTGIPGLSSTLYNGAHTFLNSLGEVKQQSNTEYLDSSRPVLQSFSTAWLKLTDLQGFQRAYWFNFLGEYISPHKLLIELAYDYDSAIRQTTIVSPDNFSAKYGDLSPYGSGIYGGSSQIEQWRIFFNIQKCQSVQITVTEIYDSTFGVAPGAGFTMSGINLVIGAKASYPKLPSSKSTS